MRTRPAKIGKYKESTSDKAYAHERTRTLVRNGLLPPVKTQKCADCGKHATEYDHPNHAEPDKVEAVCASCHKKRGRARGEYPKHLKRRNIGPLTKWHHFFSPTAISQQHKEKTGEWYS